MFLQGQNLEPKLTLYGILVKKALYNEFCRVWVKELGLGESSSGLHGIKEHPDRSKSYYDEMTSDPRRLRILFMNTDHYIRVLLHATVFSPLFLVPSLWGLLYIIQAFPDHLDFTLVDHLSPHLSTYPIRHPFQSFVSCGSQGNTVQGSSPH